MKKILITTAIDYVNGVPHIGHALEKIQADVLARYYRKKGYQVLFLTGTDENSLKNVRAAEKAGKEVSVYVDDNAKVFKDLKQALNLSWDDFIRTTEQRHIDGAQKLWLACEKDIYKKNYKGLYCVGCEEFYKEEELENGLCPEHKKPLEVVEEENYFFKLSKYEKEIREIIEKGKVEIVPETRKNEILSFLSTGLQDICISRSNERAKSWGISVPKDNTQKIWCWFDALGNYITALGYATDDQKFKDYWNNQALHVIGKGISRFHAVYWLGILLSAGLNLPKKIFVHGYVTVAGQKISKSLGNVISPFDLVEKYGTDPVRYFLLGAISPVEDGDFTYERFEEKYNADLANGLGNLVSRVLALSKDTEIKEKKCSFKAKEYDEAIENFQFYQALSFIWKLIKQSDQRVEQEKPWLLEDKTVFLEEMFANLRFIADLLEPFLPETSLKIKKQLETKERESLFPRL